jgi:hypothetical protein
MIPQKYLELLVECGVVPPSELPSVPVEPQKTFLYNEPKRCCDDIVEDTLNGCMVCCGCGLVVERKMFIYHQPYQQRSNFSNQFQKPLGSDGHVYFTRKRYYQPLTHFKEHLRRYMGARFTIIPDSILDKVREEVANVNDTNAHDLVKAVLKRNGHTRFYKEIFTIIYLCGGEAPNLSIAVYNTCIEDFKKLMYHFMKSRQEWQRHSMPSMYMLLDMLLRNNGHTPHFNFPHLKNMRLRQQVMDIYDQLRQKSAKNLSNPNCV